MENFIWSIWNQMLPDKDFTSDTDMSPSPLLIDPVCLTGEIKICIYWREICEQKLFQFSNVFHGLLILFKYAIVHLTRECNCCSFNIRTVHVTIGVTVLLGPIMIGDFSYWLRALAVWLHLQGCNTYSPQIHSPHNFSRLNRLAELQHVLLT